MIIACIVTFEPELARLESNLLAISPQVQKVLVYDNGSTSVSDISDLADSLPNVALLSSVTNDGIAAALNRLARAAIEEGADFMVTLDQDSICSPGMVDTLASEFTAEVAMVTPYIVDRNKGSIEDFAGLELPRTERYRQSARRGAITSGALVRLSAWNSVGGFDELFFIDYVDYDFNQRLMDAGFSIIRANRTALLHEVGKATPTWLRVPRKDMDGRWHFERFFAFGHSSTRCYYKVRNRILFTRKHGRRLGITHEGAWQIPQQIGLTLLFERDRRAKFAGFMRGMLDGIRMRID